MGLINATVAFNTAWSYRLVWISGRFGGGKTSLAYMLAKGWLEQGYRLVSNNKTIWGDEMKDVKLDKDGHLKCVVLLDEGGLWFKASKQIEMIASYAAKMDVIYLLPSFWPPTRAAQVLVIQPVWNLRSAGVPLTFYKWKVKLGSFQDSGWFVWFRPKEVYGIYSRQDPGDAGSEIVNWLIEKTEEYRSLYGRQNSFSEVEVTEQDILQDAVGEFAQAADTIAATIPVRRYRRR